MSDRIHKDGPQPTGLRYRINFYCIESERKINPIPL